MSVTMNQTTGQLKAIEEAREFLLPQLGGQAPEVGIILGTGLGSFASSMKSVVTIPYGEIPNFPVTSVETHAGTLVAGSLSRRPTGLLNGPAPYYERHSLKDVPVPVP